MYAAQAYQQYQIMQTQTADRGELVVMLYQGAIKFLTRASTAMRGGNLQDAHNNIIRSQDIVAELMSSLDLDVGEIAHNLFRVYEYMHYRLVEANLRKDPQIIDEVAGLLRELLPAWQSAAKEVRAGSLKSRGLAVTSIARVAW